MTPMRRLQVVYAAGCTVWALYMIRLLTSLSASHPEATLRGALICLLLLVIAPAILGYVLLFKAFPWLGRMIRRSA